MSVWHFMPIICCMPKENKLNTCLIIVKNGSVVISFGKSFAASEYA